MTPASYPHTKDCPLVSIVALCYNHDAFVEEALDSILAQTYPNIELIIIDDASADKSVSIINNWIGKNNPACNFIVHKNNQGTCKTLNESLKLVNGKYFQGFACDDIMMPTKIEEQVRFLENNTDYIAVCSNAEVVDKNSKTIKKQHFNDDFVFPEPGKVFDAVLNGHQNHWQVVHSPTVLMRTEVFGFVGYYPEDILQEDFYMWLRISSRFKIGYAPAITMKYRQHGKSLSCNPRFTERINLDILKVCKIFLDELPQKTAPLMLVQKRKLKYFLQKVYDGKMSVEKYLGYIKTFTDDALASELLSNGHLDRPLLELFMTDKKKCLKLIKNNQIQIKNKLFSFLMADYMPALVPKTLIKIKKIFSRNK